MSGIKTMDFTDRREGSIATGTYFGCPKKPERLEVGNIAQLQCDGITVLVNVTKIHDDEITGTIHSFENYDEASLNGVYQGDCVQFSFCKVHGWLG
jgi:hypothetical protein